MLYHLLNALHGYYTFLNVIRYQTFRAMVAFLFTFVLVLVLQPIFIRWFRERKLGQPIREDGPQAHQSKKGTPTMGGVVVVTAVLFSTFLFSNLTNLYVWAIMLLTAGYGALGFTDDYLKVNQKNSKGVSARTKLKYQFGIALGVLLFLCVFSSDFSTKVYLPVLKNVWIDLGWYFYLPFAALIIVGCSNAVNLTDGLDGLVTGPIMTVAFAYGVFAYTAGHERIAEYLLIQPVPEAGELCIFAAAIVAGGLGFLWFNSFPAQVFMGDVGSLALGGALGMLAVLAKQELLLVIAGGVFVLEALSVITQVSYFKMTGKRVFRMAPLHHHFELMGLAEPKIIVRCWIISIVLAIIALATLKLR